jgi:hypothetical protein
MLSKKVKNIKEKVNRDAKVVKEEKAEKPVKVKNDIKL